MQGEMFGIKVASILALALSLILVSFAEGGLPTDG